MITRRVRFQVLTFLVVSLLGVVYVGLRYVGLGEQLIERGAVVHAEFLTTGGIFPRAPVTYRGVPVGRVGAVTLYGDGVRAELRLDPGVQVPADLTAVVAQRSAVGEQYVDLRPNTDAGPYLRDGDTIPRERTATPLPVETLLANLDALVRSVGVDDLSVVIDELGQAFEGRETALRRLLDANSLLLAEANRRLPETVALIRDGRTVLATQEVSAEALRSWADDLAKLSATLRAADADLRGVLAAGPPAAAEVTALLRDLEPAVGTLLGNLVTVNGIAVRHLAGIEHVLVVFPLVVAGGFTVAPGDGTAHLGLVLNVDDPPPCNYQRSGQGPRCTEAERKRGSGVRGEQSAPRSGGASSENTGDSAQGSPAPVGAAGRSVAGYDPATGVVIGPDGRPVLFGGTGGQYRLAGEQSWKQLLLAGLAP
ncbi:MAG TPA: MCE family protein [Micromonosporaceae bacterium]|nr:MCE family protein [Micromonosporaceae bacterium]